MLAWQYDELFGMGMAPAAPTATTAMSKYDGDIAAGILFAGVLSVMLICVIGMAIETWIL